MGDWVGWVGGGYVCVCVCICSVSCIVCRDVGHRLRREEWVMGGCVCACVCVVYYVLYVERLDID